MTGKERRARLSEQVAQAGLDWLLVAEPHDLRWLTGFTGTSGIAACPAAPAEPGLFVTDFRYVEQAADQLVGDWEVVRYTKPELFGAGLVEAAGDRLSGRVGFDPRQVTVSQLGSLAAAMGDGAQLVEAERVVERLREVKDPAEVEQIAEAARLADETLAGVLEAGLGGRTEKDVATAIEVRALELGAEGLSFPPIVAHGAHGALPHAEPRDVEIGGGSLVTIDWGVRVGGYCSDCTRTYAVGEVGEQEVRAYEAVNRARAAGLAALAPGAAPREVDAHARAVIEEAGFGKQFGHGLGHGVGLDVHEEPRLSPRGSEDPLEAGMAVTVEPGIYVPGQFGVRIEDLAVVQDGGARILTSLDRELVSVD